jgi:hypothetical protein
VVRALEVVLKAARMMGVFIGIVRWRMGMATWSRAVINADLLASYYLPEISIKVQPKKSEMGSQGRKKLFWTGS